MAHLLVHWYVKMRSWHAFGTLTRGHVHHTGTYDTHGTRFSKLLLFCIWFTSHLLSHLFLFFQMKIFTITLCQAFCLLQYVFPIFFQKCLISQCRSSHRRCSVRKCVLRNFAKFIGKHLRQSLYFNKVAGQGTSERLLLSVATPENTLPFYFSFQIFHRVLIVRSCIVTIEK